MSLWSVVREWWLGTLPSPPVAAQIAPVLPAGLPPQWHTIFGALAAVPERGFTPGEIVRIAEAGPLATFTALDWLKALGWVESWSEVSRADLSADGTSWQTQHRLMYKITEEGVRAFRALACAANESP